jgi:GUN4-like/AAA-like domain
VVDQYIFSGSLPENASSYVIREADAQLYEGLKAGKFCYVLNSRQSGKSSLRVRTMQRLRDDGVQCAAVDLSAGGIQNVPPQQWYADLIDTLIDAFGLDVDFGDWWEANQLNSLVTRFRKFLEEVLLVEVKENLVIFIDEIDSVLSLNFPTDDFFALIRACYNTRVDNPEYNRLTFCLLGVASPSNLIEDKQRTPFNIGKAISLKGFQPHEVEPLEKGLYSKYANSQAIIQEILHWTGGQPFLTQKLCHFMVEESAQEHPRLVEQVVRSRIIENWESQDEPEHLRTIQARILRDEQRAGYLLELCQKVRLAEERSQVIADDTLEQSELQLSGLFVRQEGKLRVYNPIYKEVFDSYWIEIQLRKLRPYSENFKFWLTSKCTDESRLLRGKALQDALEWAEDKSLSYQDRQFLAASQVKEREEEIIAKEKDAHLERERKDKEAVEKRNLVLSKANKQAFHRIHIGSFILIITLLATFFLGRQAVISGKKVQQNQQYLITVETLAKLAGQLEDEGSDKESKELFSMAGQSVNIKDYNIQEAIINTGIAYAYSKLKSKNQLEAQKYLDKAKVSNTNKSLESLQIRLIKLKIQGSFSIDSLWLSGFKKQDDSLQEISEENIKQAIIYYRQAFDVLKAIKDKSIINNSKISPPFNPKIQNKIISKENIEDLHREFILLLSINNRDEKLKQEIEESLQEHYYDELDNLLAHHKWQEANQRTGRLMLYIANPEYQYNPSYLNSKDINDFSCQDLKRIDLLWLKYSHRHFGFSVQKNIWLELGNQLNITKDADKDEKGDIRFGSIVGWYDPQKEQWKNYNELIKLVVALSTQAPKGSLPTLEAGGQNLACKDFPLCYGDLLSDQFGLRSGLKQIFSRAVACKM